MGYQRVFNRTGHKRVLIAVSEYSLTRKTERKLTYHAILPFFGGIPTVRQLLHLWADCVIFEALDWSRSGIVVETRHPTLTPDIASHPEN